MKPTIRENTEALGPAYNDMAPGEGSGPCGAASLWACPLQAGPLRPSPVEGRSVVPALDPDRANAVPGRYAEVTSFGVGPPGHG